MNVYFSEIYWMNVIHNICYIMSYKIVHVIKTIFNKSKALWTNNFIVFGILPCYNLMNLILSLKGITIEVFDWYNTRIESINNNIILI